MSLLDLVIEILQARQAKSISDAMLELGFCASRSDAHRLMAQGAVKFGKQKLLKDSLLHAASDGTIVAFRHEDDLMHITTDF